MGVWGSFLAGAPTATACRVRTRVREMEGGGGRSLSSSILRAALTPRQASICDALMVGRGVSNAAIARQLGIAEDTVKGHLYRLFLIFRVTSRLQLVMELNRLGYQSPVTNGPVRID